MEGTPREHHLAHGAQAAVRGGESLFTWGQSTAGQSAISPEVETSSNRLNFSVFLMATSVSRSTSVSIASWTRATALEAVSHEGLQGTAETSSVVQISESTALTFTSNHACRGLWTQASESKNSVPDSKTVAMTGLGDAFVKRGSPVQVRSSA
jgi:hypothetical protein